MAIPVPFSDIYIYFGQALEIRGDMKDEEILSTISEALIAATALVEAFASETLP
jgi:lysophospholipid acyltransferase (LPLAT)-like uncharacterized protein